MTVQKDPSIPMNESITTFIILQIKQIPKISQHQDRSIYMKIKYQHFQYGWKLILEFIAATEFQFTCTFYVTLCSKCQHSWTYQGEGEYIAPSLCVKLLKICRVYIERIKSMNAFDSPLFYNYSDVKIPLFRSTISYTTSDWWNFCFDIQFHLHWYFHYGLLLYCAKALSISLLLYELLRSHDSVYLIEWFCSCFYLAFKTLHSTNILKTLENIYLQKWYYQNICLSHIIRI